MEMPDSGPAWWTPTHDRPLANWMAACDGCEERHYTSNWQLLLIQLDWHDRNCGKGL